MKQLKRRVVELEAQLASRLHFASQEVSDLTIKRYMASGIILQAHALGGAQVLAPVCIRDGLSDETVSSLKADLKRSYEIATLYKL